jgi:hypothetical protein
MMRRPASSKVVKPIEIDNDAQPWLNDMREQFWFPFLNSLPESNRFNMELSGKFLLLTSILNKCTEIGDKTLVFSRSLYTLNYIEEYLQYLHVENNDTYRKQCESRRQMNELLTNENSTCRAHDTVEHVPSPIQWQRDRDYFRIDGQTDVVTRKRYAKLFNDHSNFRSRLLLISTLAGGIGINLTGSNRVIIFDASWNPR